MTTLAVRIAAIAALALGLTGCASGPCASCTTAKGPGLDGLEEAMTGHFTSAQQASEDEAYFDVTLHMVPIWPQHTDAMQRWLYVEQAITAAADRPYRQRVYRLTAQDGALVSSVYELPGDPLRFAGAWREVRAFDAIGPADLSERAGCAIALVPQPDGSFVGSTHEDECPSDLRGASYATSRVRIHDGVVESWDQGFDAAGVQVWGAEKGPYIFRRVTE